MELLLTQETRFSKSCSHWKFCFKPQILLRFLMKTENHWLYIFQYATKINRIWIVLMTVSGGDVMVLYYLTTDERSLSQSATESPILSKPTQQARPSKVQFNPFCNVDQVELSIHCHINAVKSLLCVPGMVPKDLSKWYIYIYIYIYIYLLIF